MVKCMTWQGPHPCTIQYFDTYCTDTTVLLILCMYYTLGMYSSWKCQPQNLPSPDSSEANESGGGDFRPSLRSLQKLFGNSHTYSTCPLPPSTTTTVSVVQNSLSLPKSANAPRRNIYWFEIHKC